MSAAALDIILEFFEENGTLGRMREETAKKVREETTEKVREETAKKVREENAQEMLKDGFAPEKIAHYVKMPVEWVENLVL